MTGPVDSSTDKSSAFPRIMRRTLHEEVLERLRDMIIEGRLAPGQRINEGAVGTQLGVSRTPLREAIKTLASEGLVEILPAKGAVVRTFSARDLKNVLEVLTSLEQLAGRMACAVASDETIARLLALHDAMMALYESRNRLEYFKLNQAIHTAIVVAAGNEVLAEMHGNLQARIKRLRFIGNEGPEKWAGAVAEHEMMMKALAARDGEALAAAIGTHMDSTLTRVSETI
jgi:DNA-binding GntR family transcriptional regulator